MGDSSQGKEGDWWDLSQGGEGDRWDDAPVPGRCHQAERKAGWQAGGSVHHNAWATQPYAQGSPHADGTSGLSEVAQLVLLYHWPSRCSSYTLHRWSPGCYHMTKGRSLCWHHSRTWELSCPSVCGFPCANSSPVPQAHTPPPPALPMSDIEVSGTPIGFSSWCSSLVQNPGSAIIPLTVCLMTNMTRGLSSASRKSPLMMAATDPIRTLDQLPSKVAESESLSLISRMPRVTVGTVYHRSSPSLTMEPSPEPGAIREHQQLATSLTSLNSSSSIPPPIQTKSMPTLTMSWSRRTLGAQETGTPSWGWAKMMPTRVMLSLTQKVTCRWATLTLVLSQWLGTTAHMLRYWGYSCKVGPE